MSVVKTFDDPFDIFKAIRRAEKDLGNPEITWYRGHSSDKFKLLPSLFRYQNGLDEEQSLFNRYRNITKNMPESRSDDWLAIVDMQHYGIPTRLLDWTNSLGIAVYFAISEYLNNSNGKILPIPCIYILDPLELNRLSYKKGHILPVPGEAEFEYRKIYWEGPFPPQSPIAIEPASDNRRALAQKSVFTIHNSSLTPLDETAGKAVRRVKILKSNIQQMLDFLKFAGINEPDVFPDIAGVVKFINKSTNLIPMVL